MSSISSISSGNVYQPDYSSLSKNILSQADSDGDGYLSKDELSDLLETNKKMADDLNNYYGTSSTSGSSDSIFTALDTDGDGLVSVSELSTAVTNTKGGQVDGPPPPPPSSEDLVSSADTDGSGTLSQTELESLLNSNSELASALSSLVSDSSSTTSASTTADSVSSTTAASILSALDTDGDGSVSAAELSTAFGKVLDDMKAGGPPPAPFEIASGSTSLDSISLSTLDLSSTDTSTSSDLQALLGQLIGRLEQQQSAYSVDGSANSASLPSFFKTTA